MTNIKFFLRKEKFPLCLQVYRAEPKWWLGFQSSLLLWCQYVWGKKSTKFHYFYLQLPCTDFRAIVHVDLLLKSYYKEEINGNLRLGEIFCQYHWRLLFSKEISMLIPQVTYLRCESPKAMKKEAGSEAWFQFGQQLPKARRFLINHNSWPKHHWITRIFVVG